MKSVTPISNTAPAFGMAVKFNKAGRKFFNEVFKDNPKAAEQYILRQAKNKSSDIFVKGSEISVGFEGQNWNIAGYILTEKPNGKFVEEILLMRNKNPLMAMQLKTLIRESSKPFSEIYGDSGKLLAAAEDIANYQSYVNNNKAPSLLQKIKSIFTRK